MPLTSSSTGFGKTSEEILPYPRTISSVYFKKRSTWPSVVVLHLVTWTPKNVSFIYHAQKCRWSRWRSNSKNRAKNRREIDRALRLLRFNRWHNNPPEFRNRVIHTFTILYPFLLTWVFTNTAEKFFKYIWVIFDSSKSFWTLFRPLSLGTH